MRPTRDPPIGLFALLFVAELCVPEAARACGDDGALFIGPVAKLAVFSLFAFAAQVVAGRFVDGRVRSTSTVFVSVAGLLVAGFGVLAGFVLAVAPPVVGIPLVVLEVMIGVGFVRALVAPRVGDAAPVL